MRYEKAIKKLIAKADELRYSQAEIAKGSNLSPAQVSRIFNFKSAPSQESLVAIAKFLRIVPPEEILRVAGLLPQKSEVDEDMERAEHYLSHYKYPETKKRALVLLKVLSDEEENEEYRVMPARRPAPPEPG